MQNDPNDHSYGELLFRREWKEKRKHIMERDGNRCVICGSTEDLQIHHRQYRFNEVTNRKVMPWDYPDKCLITLCKSCHEKGHRLHEIPTKIIKK